MQVQTGTIFFTNNRDDGEVKKLYGYTFGGGVNTVNEAKYSSYLGICRLHHQVYLVSRSHTVRVWLRQTKVYLLS